MIYIADETKQILKSNQDRSLRSFSNDLRSRISRANIDLDKFIKLAAATLADVKQLQERLKQDKELVKELIPEIKSEATDKGLPGLIPTINKIEEVLDGLDDELDDLSKKAETETTCLAACQSCYGAIQNTDCNQTGSCTSCNTCQSCNTSQAGCTFCDSEQSNNCYECYSSSYCNDSPPTCDTCYSATYEEQCPRCYGTTYATCLEEQKTCDYDAGCNNCQGGYGCSKCNTAQTCESCYGATYTEACGSSQMATCMSNYDYCNGKNSLDCDYEVADCSEVYEESCKKAYANCSGNYIPTCRLFNSGCENIYAACTADNLYCKPTYETSVFDCYSGFSIETGETVCESDFISNCNKADFHDACTSQYSGNSSHSDVSCKSGYSNLIGTICFSNYVKQSQCTSTDTACVVDFRDGTDLCSSFYTSNDHKGCRSSWSSSGSGYCKSEYLATDNCSSNNVGCKGGYTSDSGAHCIDCYGTAYGCSGCYDTAYCSACVSEQACGASQKVMSCNTDVNGREAHEEYSCNTCYGGCDQGYDGSWGYDPDINAFCPECVSCQGCDDYTPPACSGCYGCNTCNSCQGCYQSDATPCSYTPCPQCYGVEYTYCDTCVSTGYSKQCPLGWQTCGQDSCDNCYKVEYCTSGNS